MDQSIRCAGVIWDAWRKLIINFGKHYIWQNESYSLQRSVGAALAFLPCYSPPALGIACLWIHFAGQV